MVGQQIGYYVRHGAPQGRNSAAGTLASTADYEASLGKFFITEPVDDRFLYQTWRNLDTDVKLYEATAPNRWFNEELLGYMQNIIDTAFGKVQGRFAESYEHTDSDRATYDESLFKVLENKYEAAKGKLD